MAGRWVIWLRDGQPLLLGMATGLVWGAASACVAATLVSATVQLNTHAQGAATTPSLCIWWLATWPRLSMLECTPCNSQTHIQL